MGYGGSGESGSGGEVQETPRYVLKDKLSGSCSLLYFCRCCQDAARMTEQRLARGIHLSTVLPGGAHSGYVMCVHHPSLARLPKGYRAHCWQHKWHVADEPLSCLPASSPIRN